VFGQDSPYKRKATSGNSHSIISPKCFAPAYAHKGAYLLILLSNKSNGGICLLWTTRALRWFQTSEVTSRLREATALRFGVDPLVMVLHQYARLRDPPKGLVECWDAHPNSYVIPKKDRVRESHK
jgi:hypothetical protein